MEVEAAKLIGAGLAVIGLGGVGAGIGHIFASLISAIARNPSARPQVFPMGMLGFALVEAGFTRAKNVCNIIMKNLMDVSIGSVIFWLFGFGLMFGVSNGYFGTNFFMFDGSSEIAKETGN